MKTRCVVLGTSIILASLLATAYASQDTIGPNGINSVGLTTFTGQPLNGQGQDIGMVEDDRPGKPAPAGPDNFQHSNSTIIPNEVFLHTGPVVPNGAEIDDHAEWVAGVMISTDPINAMGVATAANLHAAAFVGDLDIPSQAAESNQFIAGRASGFVSAINMSFVTPLAGNEVLDGNSLYTEYIDWSAKRYDVLQLQGGREPVLAAGHSSAIDNYNGITVGSLAKDLTGMYTLVATGPNGNDYSENSYSVFNRTFVSLMARGDDVQATGLGSIPTTVVGTSFATPHVTATVALLQQYGQERFSAGDPKFPTEYRHHEVMKAVLLNSANKIKDDVRARSTEYLYQPAGSLVWTDQ